MSIVTSEVGIDVHKAKHFVSIDCGKPFEVENTQEALEQLVKELPHPCVVHVEASGGYERLLVRILREAGIDIRAHNALKAHRLSQAMGSAAKTDPVDSKALSARGKMLPICEPKTPERQALTDLSRALDSIRECIADLKKRRKMPEIDASAQAVYSDTIKALCAQLKAGRKQFEIQVKASSLAKLYEVANSLPGVGPETARTCLCELPENWKTASMEQLSAYAGLAPIDDASGQRTGKSHVGHGNKRLKGAFYMPALYAIKHLLWAQELYDGLRAKGRTHLQAIVAVMRRLFIRVVAVMKRGTPWVEEALTAKKAENVPA